MTGPDSENRCGISTSAVHLVSTATITRTQQLNCLVISDFISLFPPLLTLSDTTQLQVPTSLILQLP